MNPSNQSLETTLPEKEVTQAESPSSEQGNSMAEFYQLRQSLLLGTLVASGVIFIPVWIVYSIDVALSYLLGACVGVVYLRMLAKDVERLGEQNQRLGSKGLALFAALIIVAAKWQQLQILPVFLGFMTYKVTILIYVLRTSVFPAQNRDEVTDK